jgi:hypothetical protein
MYYDRDPAWDVGCILASDCLNPGFFSRDDKRLFWKKHVVSDRFFRAFRENNFCFHESSIVKKLNKEVWYEGSFV